MRIRRLKNTILLKKRSLGCVGGAKVCNEILHCKKLGIGESGCSFLKKTVFTCNDNMMKPLCDRVQLVRGLEV